MMKYLAALLLFGFFSCKTKTAETRATTADSAADQKLFIPSSTVKYLEGTYTGNFDNGYITLVLNYINGKNVSGYNLHKGIRRNINGTLQQEANGYKFILKEPGDNPFDGTFEFTIDTIQFSANGTWKPFDPSKTSSKKLALLKKPGRSGDSYEDYLGMWIPATGTYNLDTILEFSTEGTCEYKFYASPGDSTLQVNTVTGNYVLVKDTVFIEWQKNAFTPVQNMKLVKRIVKIKSQGDTYDELQLSGNGWKFVQMDGY